MIVSPDRFELPMFVGDKLVDAARFCGRTATSLSHELCVGSSGLRSGFKVVRVEIDEGEEE